MLKKASVPLQLRFILRINNLTIFSALDWKRSGAEFFLLDIANKKMYNINRVGDNIASIEEYDTANGNTLVGTMYYSFDSDGKQFRKKYIDADGSMQNTWPLL